MNAVAPASKVKSVLAAAFPGIRFTSEQRSQEEQDALVAAGKTKARNSQHVSGTGLDVVLPKGTDLGEVRKTLVANGINPSEFLNETGKGKNQGTGAHLHIGWAAKGGDPGSTYDRVRAQRQETGPSLEKAYAAYRSGQMAPQDAAAFENAVNSGQIMLPRGGKLNKEPAAWALPANLVKAYNSHEMSEEDRAAIDQAVANGEASLPRGAVLKRPDPRTAGDLIGMGARGVMTGAGSLGDVISSPVRFVADAAGVPGMDPNGLRKLAETGADSLGLAKPESGAEQLTNALVEGGTQGLATAGLATPLAGAAGATGSVARALMANPVVDTVSGATAAGSSEVARQAGVGPTGQLIAGLAGGLSPVAGAGIAGRTASRAVRTAPEIAQTTPKSVLIDEAGNLTDDGIEAVARNNIPEAELRQAYEAPPNVQRGVANDMAIPAEAVARTADEALPPNVIEPMPPVRPVEATPAPIPDPPPIAPDAPPTVARMAEAQSEGIPLTRGQATQDFAAQDAEQTLRAAASGEGEKARTFLQEQAAKITDAVDRFKTAFGPEATATDRGQVVKDAVRELRDLGKAGVSALYKQAEELGGESLGLITDDIKRVATDILIDEGIPETVKKSISQQMARYGLIGKAEKMNEVGITKVVLDDGSTVSFRGEPEPLTVANAEALRKAVNDLYTSDPTHRSQALKPVLDDAVEEAIESAANKPPVEGRPDGQGVADAYKAARSAFVEQKQTFAAKDIVQKLIDWKKGATDLTDVLASDKAIDAIFAGGVPDLKKVKAVLLASPTPASKEAWKAIQATGIGKIFDKAYTVNANLGGGNIGTVSGAKLNSEIARFGTDKLKVLLSDAEFNQLMKLKRVIGNATIPISGTTNPSGTAFKMMRFLGPMAARIVPFGGQIADTVAGLVKQAKGVAEAQKTLSGVTNYTPEAAVADAAPKPSVAAKADEAANAFIQNFIELAGSGRLLAPILASGAQGEDAQ